jgi:hypothetical protein
MDQQWSCKNQTVRAFFTLAQLAETAQGSTLTCRISHETCNDLAKLQVGVVQL